MHFASILRVPPQPVVLNLLLFAVPKLVLTDAHELVLRARFKIPTTLGDVPP
jgi:hypothetical protein